MSRNAYLCDLFLPPEVMKYLLILLLFSVPGGIPVTDDSRPEAPSGFLYSVAVNPDDSRLVNKDIQFSILLLDPKGRTLHETPKTYWSFDRDIRTFDLHRYWENRGNERYYVAFTKVAFIVDQEVRRFSPERLSDLSYLQKTLGDYTVSKMAYNRFQVAGTLFSPGFTYDLSFYRWPAADGLPARAIQKSVDENPQLGMPALTAIQHHYDYGKVLMHRTTKMSTTLTNYYPFRHNQTLVLVYSLNYIYNIPPAFVGGENLMVSEIKSMIRDYVARTRDASHTQY
jgi:hypothetical protein